MSIKRRTNLAAMGLILGVFLAVSPAAGALVFTAGSATITEGTPSVTIPVTVSGGDAISGLSLVFSVGDGGPAMGGVDVVPIIAPFSIAGGIFDVPAYNTSVTATPSLPSASTTVIDIVIFEPGLNAAGNGLVINLTLDTSALPSGSVFALHPTTDEFPTEAIDSSGFYPTIDTVSGTLTVVPEPAGLAILGLAAPALLRRRKVI